MTQTVLCCVNQLQLSQCRKGALSHRCSEFFLNRSIDLLTTTKSGSSQVRSQICPFAAFIFFGHGKMGWLVRFIISRLTVSVWDRIIRHLDQARDFIAQIVAKNKPFLNYVTVYFHYLKLHTCTGLEFFCRSDPELPQDTGISRSRRSVSL